MRSRGRITKKSTWGKGRYKRLPSAPYGYSRQTKWSKGTRSRYRSRR